MEERATGAERKMDISRVIEMQSNRDGHVEKLGDVSLIGTLIQPGRIGFTAH